MKPTIICIVGPSGCGKTTLVKHIYEELHVPFLVSYTTRPKRDNEVEGIDHYFVNESQMPPKSEMLAYTFFGGYHYWTNKKDIPDSGAVTYVIDEKGLMMLMEDFSEEYNIYSILIKRDEDKLIKTVGNERVKRDKCRVKIETASYDSVIDNNGSLYDFYKAAIRKIQLMID